MTNPVSNIGQLISIIRTQFASRGDEIFKKRNTSTTASRNSNVYYSSSPEKLESLIRQRIKEIDPDDPGKGRKAFRVFLESILLSHFGSQFINDPMFHGLVDDVQAAMEAEPEVAHTIEIAVAHLLSAS